MEISPRTYYKYRNKPDEDLGWFYLIEQEFLKSMKTYGYRRVTQALRNGGYIINAKKVARIMRKYRLTPPYIKKRKINHSRITIQANIASNILNRRFNVNEPNKVWCTDITYIEHKGQRRYLSVIIDLYDNYIVSYKIHHSLNIELVIDTLRYATLMRPGVKNVIIHSDQGVQYTSLMYKEFCKANGFIISMSRKGNPRDNAVIESLFRKMKQETKENNEIKSIDHYVELVFDWIWFHNHDMIRAKKKL